MLKAFLFDWRKTPDVLRRIEQRDKIFVRKKKVSDERLTS